MKETLPHTIDKLFWNIAVNDDENAFKTLFFQFFSPLCIFAHRYIERWETCEDVVQESFLKIWENRKSIRIETSARNFLVTSVRNNCIDYLRKQELELAWKQWKISKGDEPSGDIYSIVELRTMLAEALDKLPENTRLIFEKNRFEGKKYTEIAEEQQISVKTVEAHISKALKILRVERKTICHSLFYYFKLLINIFNIGESPLYASNHKYMTNVNIQTEHIIAYLEGKLSKEDSLAFEKQMLDSPELRKEVGDLRFICDTSQMLYLQEKIDVDNHWKNVSRTMQKNRFRQKIGRYFRYTAAILLIPALISSIYFYQRIYRLENQPIEQVELSSAYGLVSKITLPDGSEVWLNSGSKLHYPKQFVGDHRKVYLSGEAYFKVSSDKKHRFDVALSNGITVSAYGTEFNINAYEDDDEIQATLANGSIEIRNEKKPIPQVLNPGEQAVYNKITDNTKVSDINLYMVTSWKEGKMVFRRTEMAEIAQRLSRHFNVNIILQSKKIFNYKYSATFTTETFEEILQLLEKTAPIKCTMIEPKQASDYSYTRRTVIIEAR